jgi:hypothetical protein
MPKSSTAAEVLLVPGILLLAEYDDNVDFRSDSDDAEDDFAGSARPNARIVYNTERLNLTGLAEIDFKKYLNQTDFDRTNQLYQIETAYQAHSRWTLSGNYEFRRDETTDSQFEETGRAFDRRRQKSHSAGAGVQFAVTELSNMGSFVFYRRADFSSSEDVDYDYYTIEVPYSKEFQNQIDTIRIAPGYSRYNSDDNEKADDYRLTFGWSRLISETLTFDMSIGPRYTRVENADGDKNGSFSGVGEIGMVKRGETFTGEIRYSRDIKVSTEGQLINVDRFSVFADKKVTERFGTRFSGNAYYSNRENDDEPDEKVVSFELIPSVYYMLAENHFVELSYNYRNQRELDEPGNPTTQRNRVVLSFNFAFPKRWD